MRVIYRKKLFVTFCAILLSILNGYSQLPDPVNVGIKQNQAKLDLSTLDMILDFTPSVLYDLLGNKKQFRFTDTELIKSTKSLEKVVERMMDLSNHLQSLQNHKDIIVIPEMEIAPETEKKTRTLMELLALLGRAQILKKHLSEQIEMLKEENSTKAFTTQKTVQLLGRFNDAFSQFKNCALVNHFKGIMVARIMEQNR